MNKEDWIRDAELFLKDPNPFALKAWVNSIPAHEIGALSSVLPTIYTGLAKLDANAEQLSDYTETLRPILQNAAKELSQTNVKNFESHEEAYTFSQLYLKLLSLEASSWENILKKAASENNEACLHKAIHRSMTAQLSIHLAHYQFYLPMPAKEWLKLHKLFYLAAQRKQAGFTTADVCLYPGQRLTISNIYTIALLLGCARTNKLSPINIKTVYELLKHWGELVSISRTPSQSGDNQLVVDITTGAAPNFYKLFTATEKSVPCYLQVESLIQRMDKILQPDSNTSFATLPIENIEGNHELIAHLKSAWCEYLHREERIATHQSAYACIGLINIHFYLSGNKKLTDFIGLKSSLSIVYEDDDDVSTIVTQRGTDVWSWTPAKVTLDSDISFTDIPPEYHFQRYFDADYKQSDEAHTLFSVIITDSSAHGYRIEWPVSETNISIEVGELIGIKTEDSKHLKIGIVMWMDYVSNAVLRTGIKIISTQAFPVGVDVPLTATVTKNITEGVLLPPQPEFNQNISFIVEPNLFKENDYTTISQKNIEERIKLATHIKSGSSYSLNECGFVIKK